MSTSQRTSASRPTRGRRGLHIALGLTAALVLIGFFLARSFPTGALARRAEAELASATGAQVSVGAWHPSFGWRGPQARLERVEIRWPQSVPVRVDRIDVRPAWSLAWLGGSAWALGLEGEFGSFAGTAVNDGGLHCEGELRDFDLRYLMLVTTMWQMEGRLDADLDVTQRDGRVDGQVALRGRDGMLRIPSIVAPIPFEVLDGRLRLGGDAFLTIEALDLAGPLATVKLTGRIGHAPIPDRAPLRFEGEIQVDEPGVRGAMGVQGLRFDPSGRARFQVHGTLAEPVLR